MTIAMCYLLGEGVVLAADSTTSTSHGGFHYFNNNQKLFEIGQNSTLGIITWGLGSLKNTSHRTLVADFADYIKENPQSSVLEVVERWTDHFYAAYISDPFYTIFDDLHKKQPHDPGHPDADGLRTEQDEQLYEALSSAMVVGFCIGGRVGPNRTPAAYEVLFEPLAPKPTPQLIPTGTYRFWGVPNMADRLIHGADQRTRAAIVASSLWGGTAADLDALLQDHQLTHASLPIRDAIDFVHMCIHSTIKALKFSAYSQVCGGPIEICTITTDRDFRWVKHKRWDAALMEGEH